ncbi:MAG: family N-acetyltransferase, partial [Nocardioidaceae bacterium]|nr:family N-acetyltransferase [Nocardioidaceae bacterium]
LAVPELSADLSERISRGVRGTVGLSNPVDLGAGVTPDDFAAAITPLLLSDEVDAVVVLLVDTVMTERGALVDALCGLRSLAPEKPILMVTYGAVTSGAHPGVTSYDSARSALGALAHASTYAAWLRVPRADEEPPDTARTIATRVSAGELAVPAARHAGWLDPSDVGTLLTPYGLAPVGTVAQTRAAALLVADDIGFPVAVKVADPEIVHKSDRGLVRVALRTPAELDAALASFGQVLGADEVPVLLQPMLDGVEVALGMVRDASFGALVMVAAGGVDIDVWDDRVFLLAPVSHQDAARAVRSLRIWPLLNGHRGRPVADIARLEQCLVDLGQLAQDSPLLAELDLNPVLVGTEGVHIVDAKVRLGAGTAHDAGVPRRLRPTR